MIRLNATIVGGIGGTIIMSSGAALIGMAGGPNMNAALLLAYMLGVPSVVGWILHFVVGVSFALIYTFLVMPRLKRIASPLVKGIIFGLLAFLMAQISLPV